MKRYIIPITLEDRRGRQVKASECTALEIDVWTQNPQHYLTLEEAEEDADGRQWLSIPMDEMRELESGVIVYRYGFYDPDGHYCSRQRVTNQYWANAATGEEKPEEPGKPEGGGCECGVSVSPEDLAEALNGYQPKGDYLTEHQSLEGYAKEEWVKERISEIPQPDLEGYEQKMTLETVDTETLAAECGHYYRFDSAVNKLTVTLPDMEGVQEIADVMLCLETGSAPQVVIEALDETEIMYRPDYSIEGGRKYEVYMFYNGKNWIVANECYE